MTDAFKEFVDQGTVLLTTYRRDGTPVGTPVNFIVDGERAFVRTFDTAWKLKCIRNNPAVELAPATFLGKPNGSAPARALDGGASEHASRIISKKYPVLHGFLVPLIHRLRGNSTIHLELTPRSSGSGS